MGKKKYITRYRCSILYNTLLKTETGACRTIRRIKRYLDEGYLFPSTAYAAMIREQVYACKRVAVSPDFYNICTEVIALLDKQI